MARSSVGLNVVLIGATEQVWPVAGFILSHLPLGWTLSVLEDQSSSSSFEGQTLAWDHPFFKDAGMSSQELMKLCSGYPSLGVECENWSGEGSQFLAAQSGDLLRLNDIEIHQILLKAAQSQGQSQHLNRLYEPFRFCAKAAKAGRFSLPTNDPASPSALLAPELAIDWKAYSELARKKHGGSVKTYQGIPVELISDGVDDRFRAIRLENGELLEGDLFMNMSANLEELKAAGLSDIRKPVGCYSWFNRVSMRQVHHIEKSRQGNPRLRACPDRVEIQTPLKNKTVEISLWHADAQAREGAAGSECQTLDYSSNEQPWAKNIIQLGHASAVIGPVFSADLRLLTQQLMRLVSLLPSGRSMQSEATAFNGIHRDLVAEISDYVSLLFVLNGREEPVWEAIKSAPVSAGLRRRIEQFLSRGRFMPYEYEVFDRQNWVDCLIGYGLVPQRVTTQMRTVDPRLMAPVLHDILGQFDRAIRNMPTQERFSAA